MFLVIQKIKIDKIQMRDIMMVCCLFVIFHRSF